jgi:replicative DNA helicase
MIAGPNGAGKTTLVRSLLQKGFDLGEYINPDDIADDLQGAPDERTRRAQTIADQRREECIAARRSFSFETVMSHPSKIDILVRAKDAGYRVCIYFIGTDDPQTNVERVALRVAQGGHNVPTEKIRERWLRTMNLLQQAIRASDQSYIFDNSAVGTIDTIPRLVFRRTTSQTGRLPQSEMIGYPPGWVQRFVLSPLGTDLFDSYTHVRHRRAAGSIVTLPLQIEAVEAEPPTQEPGLHQFSGAVSSAIDAAAQAYNQQGVGFKTGIRELDRQIVGLQASEFAVLASRPGMGKTALATNIAYNISRSWRPRGDPYDVQGGIVGFFSLEMSAEQVGSRIISQQSSIPLSAIRRGAIREAQFEVIRDLSIEFQNLPFYIDDAAILSIDQLIARAGRLKREKGLDLLVIDNLELLRRAARANFGETKRDSNEIARKLKQLAKTLNVAVLALDQLPSKIDRRRDPRPRLYEFGDDGVIEQDADLIIFLHRDEYHLLQERPLDGSYEFMNWANQVDLAHGKAELIVAKQRNGTTGSVMVHFDESCGSFSDLVWSDSASLR